LNTLTVLLYTHAALSVECWPSTDTVMYSASITHTEHLLCRIRVYFFIQISHNYDLPETQINTRKKTYDIKYVINI